MLLGRLLQQARFWTKFLWRLNCGSSLVQLILFIKARLLCLEHFFIDLCLSLVLARVDLLEAAKVSRLVLIADLIKFCAQLLFQLWRQSNEFTVTDSLVHHRLHIAPIHLLALFR